MHYYQFHIGDYRKDTVHLSRLEHSIYRDLIDWYYLDEAPIPLETQSVSRRLRLVSQEERDALVAVLNDFFEPSNDGWRHARIDQEIIDYHAVCERNRLNGKKGGRPKNPVGSQSQPSRNPNHKPLTNNQEPITKGGGRFAPPSISEVSEYVREKGYSIDPQQFVDFYAAKGWMVGSNKMKDWKASVRTWVNRERTTQKQNTTTEVWKNAI